MKFTEDPRLDELAQKERSLYLALKDLEDLHKAAKAELCDYIEATGSNSIRWGDTVITRVAVEKVRVDEDLLKKYVPAEVWERVTEEKVVTAKLTEAVTDGSITQDAIEAAITITTNRPYPSYKKAEDDAVED